MYVYVEKRNPLRLSDFPHVFFDFLSVHTNHTQSTSAVFPRGCSEPSFHTLHSVKRALQVSSRGQSKSNEQCMSNSRIKLTVSN